MCDTFTFLFSSSRYSFYLLSYTQKTYQSPNFISWLYTKSFLLLWSSKLLESHPSCQYVVNPRLVMCNDGTTTISQKKKKARFPQQENVLISVQTTPFKSHRFVLLTLFFFFLSLPFQTVSGQVIVFHVTVYIAYRSMVLNLGTLQGIYTSNQRKIEFLM